MLFYFEMVTTFFRSDNTKHSIHSFTSGEPFVESSVMQCNSNELYIISIVIGSTIDTMYIVSTVVLSINCYQCRYTILIVRR